MRAELAAAQRDGDVLAPGDSGLTLRDDGDEFARAVIEFQQVSLSEFAMDACCRGFDNPVALPSDLQRTENLRAVHLLLGHSKLESTVRYLGIEVDDALEISEQTEV